MTTTSLDNLIATAQDQAARYLAADLTYRTTEIQDALILRLERIWQTPPAGTERDDRLILAALARLSTKTQLNLVVRANQMARYVAARCITHHMPDDRTGGAR
jgi:hypothetical protein